jgi:hypothetical protein
MINLSGMKVSSANRADLKDILVLMGLVQPHLKRSDMLLNWQYFGQKDIPSKIYIIREQASNKLVSMYVAVGQHIQINKDKFVGRMVQDVMTLPEYRGRGFLHHLAERCLADIKKNGEIAYTFPNEYSHRSFFRRGWSRLYSVPTREKPIDSKTRFDSSTEIVPIEGSYPKEVTDIGENSGLNAGVYRSSKFLNWRYSKPNEHYYKFLTSDNKGFLVLKLFDDGKEKTVHLLDLVVRIEYRDLLPSMLDYSQDLAISLGASKMTCWLPSGHPYLQSFSEFGFMLKERPERFIYVFTGNMKINIDDWHMSQGDSDVF